MKGAKLLNRIARKIQISSPTILSLVGAGGVIATSIIAVKATPKALRILEDQHYHHYYNSEEPNNVSKMDIIKMTWKCYIPTAIVGTSTIACILGANVLNKKNQASLVSLYSMVDQSYKRYKLAAGEVFGEDADKKIKAQVAKDTYVSCDGNKVYSPDQDGSEKVLFYDYFSGRYFTSTIAAVINAQYHMNRNFILRGESCINEFYNFLGIDPIEGGDDIGWADEYAEAGFAWIDFEISKITMDDILSTSLGDIMKNIDAIGDNINLVEFDLDQYIK